MMLQDMHTRASRYLTDKAMKKPGAESRQKSSRAALPPLFEHIHSSGFPVHEKSIHRLTQEGFSVVVAGGETSARILAYGIFYILTHPQVLRQMQHELDATMPDASKIPPIRVLEDLPYLTAVIKEALRISAIPTSRFPLTAPEELQYRSWMIPSNTPVGMTPHDVLFDPKVFEEPGKFDPERWIQEPHLERYLVIFGKGTRMCQGMR
ncbi:MAG: hypothetical protein Q9198_007995 [Flavoplaca austrocitrina]